MKNILKKLYLFYLRKSLGQFGNSSWMSPLGTYLDKNKICIGNNVYIGRGAHISASEGFQVGDGVVIGPELMVMGGDHRIDQVGLRMYQMTTGGKNKPVVIEDDVWIGGRVILLKGVKVGEGSVIGAGSVVTRDTQPYSISAGNPARKIGTRYSKEALQEHLKRINSRYTFDQLRALYE